MLYMAKKCLTDGMVVHTNICDVKGKIVIAIEIPHQEWDKETVEIIDDRLFDAIEYALAPYWQDKQSKEA
jgi:hypothetical protein